MNLLWDREIAGVTSLPVTIMGQVTSEGSGAAQEIAWSGEATAAEPLVAISLVSTVTGLGWAKSHKYSRLGEYSAIPISIRLYSPPWKHPHGFPALYLDLVAAGAQVGTWASADGNLFGQLQKLSPVYHTRTGRFIALAQQGEVSVGLVFFARRDVSYARKCIWNLRSSQHPQRTWFLAPPSLCAKPLESP